MLLSMGVELFEAFQYSLDPAIYLGSFDECECDHDMPYWGFEARHSLVSHHVDPELSEEGISPGSVAIK